MNECFSKDSIVTEGILLTKENIEALGGTYTITEYGKELIEKQKKQNEEIQRLIDMGIDIWF